MKDEIKILHTMHEPDGFVRDDGDPWFAAGKTGRRNGDQVGRFK